MHDLVLANADIADGTGTAKYKGHVVIQGDRIAEIVDAATAQPEGNSVVDMTGLTLAPGFIDMHSHSDMAVLQSGDHSSKLAQGVTLEVCGQDGMGLAPLGNDDTRDVLLSLVDAWYGQVADVKGTWASIDEYLRLIDQGSPTNVAYLVPLGTVRAKVMGLEDRAPSPTELEQMKIEIVRGMQEGALGISSGLSYTPGSYADTCELVELSRVAGTHGGFHHTHHRTYGRGALEAYEEVVRIAEMSDCPVHLSHAVIDFPENYGRDRDLYRLIDSAQHRGVAISLDAYPYEKANTKLSAMLPGWVHAEGPEATVQLLQDPATRERIRVDMEDVGSDGAFGIPMGWELYEIGSRPQQSEWVGMTITEAAVCANKPPAEFFFDLLLEDDLGTLALIRMGHEEHIQRTMQHPAFTVGSDGLLLGARPHPRGWGSFPRYLGHYARDLELLRMEECVAHMTSIPAARLRLKDRGLIAPGYFADIVAFDAETVIDLATYDDPKAPPRGIPHVLINGQFAVRSGKLTGVRAGHAIRNTRDTHS